ncbi:hypothetical protein MKW94_005318 [Papaver nudicaule]|uniref:Uncharacterized protein n=1 Tax=Papaver nudicaule TaxID=74823 RepID=A0AA41S8S9_PAPNU|nr:hypothetical protein [Papaver nudicaule]
MSQPPPPPPAAAPSVLPPPPPPPPRPLHKQRSWSYSSPSDMHREEVCLRRKRTNRIRRTSSLGDITDDDLDELKACVELGFGFDSPKLDHRKLSDTLPALELYYATKKQHNDKNNNSGNTTPRTLTHSASSSSVSECDALVKTRLRQWAQVVACTARQNH